MKNIVIGILLAATAVFGGLYFQQRGKTSDAQARIAGLEQEAVGTQTRLDELGKRAAGLRDQLREAQAAAVVKAAALAQAEERAKAAALPKAPEPGQSAPALASQAQADASTNAKPSNPFGALFKSPEMRDMIKTQQKAVLGTMLDKNYAKLIADLHLTPDQSASLKEMIMNKTLSAADMGMSMLSDDMDATKRADLAQQVKATNDVIDAQIKQFLGDDNFTQFQAYEKTQGERMAVSTFKDQLGSGPMALSADQEQQLIQAMGQERQNFKYTTDFNDQSKFTGDFASMFSEDKVNQFFQEQEKLNQQYLTRAQSILSTDQIAAFEKNLAGQRDMQKAAMQMASKLFAPSKPAGN